MRISKTTLGLSFGVACAWGLVACSDGDTSQGIPGDGGASGASHAAGAAGHAGSSAGSPGGGVAGADMSEGGATVGGGGAGNEGGATAGSGGATAGAGGGTAGAPTAGTGGGGAPAIVPLTVVIDSWFIRPKGSNAGNAGAGGTGGAGGGGGAGTAGGGAGGLGGGGASGGGAGGASGGGAGGASGGGAGGASGGGAGGGGASGGGAGGTAGAGGGGAAGISGGGAGGAVSLPGVTRIYAFDTDTMPWVLNPYGSTPGIGNQGGAEKLSALSLLGLNATEGNPAPKSAQIIAPFSMGSEQLDINQGVAPVEDWTGFEVVAKIKVITPGHTPSACMGAWLYTTSEGYFFGRGPEVFLSPDKGWINLRFDLDAPSAYMEDHGTLDTFDKTKINQVGMQLETFRCP